MARTKAWTTAWTPRVLSILRVVSGLVFLQYGTMKVFNFPAVDSHKPFELLTVVPGLAGLLELVGGALIVLGLFTRPTAFILSGFMAVAYWTAHVPKSFYPALNYGDSAVLFSFLFLYLVFAGPGPWSLDAIRRRR